MTTRKLVTKIMYNTIICIIQKMYNICTVYGKQLTITEGSIVSPGVVVTAGKVEETTLKSSMSDTPNREKYRQYKNHHY